MGSPEVTDRGEARQVAVRASVWTVILLSVVISAVMLGQGIADGQSMAVRLGTLGAVLAAMAAATMHITSKIERGALSYTRGFRDGFSEARSVNAVLPFPSEREPSRL